MPEYTHLIGAEDVRRAASEIRSAIELFGRNVASFEQAILRHETFLNDWLERFERVFSESDEKGRISLPDPPMPEVKP